MRLRSIHSFLILFAAIILFSCAQQEDTCERDKIDEDWKAVATNSECSDTDRAEAYLALGGFSYASFVGQDDPNVAQILGLSAGNWSTKKSYFDAAINLTNNFKNGRQKTIYLFGSFLAMYTSVSGNLDNGTDDASTDATAFDGEFAQSEIDAYVGSSISSDPSGDGTQSDDTKNKYQFKLDSTSDTNYYILDFDMYDADNNSDFIFLDVSGDGSGDTALTLLDKANLLLDMSNDGVIQLNKVVYLKALANPFDSSNDVVANINKVNSFATDILDYITNINRAIGTEGLNLDPSDDSIVEIQKLKSALDNGGSCSTITDNESIKLMGYFRDSFQKTAIADYSSANLFTIQRLLEIGSDVSPDIPSVTGLTIDPSADLGAKFIFRSAADPNSYIPYWENDSDPEISGTLEIVELFNVASDEKGNGSVVFSEVLCVSDALDELSSE